MMEKKELIENYLLDENAEKVRKKRFEIAWDIYEYFNDTLFDVRKKFVTEVCNELKSSKEFKGYEIEDLGLTKGNVKKICISKQSWLLSRTEKIGILNYSLGSGVKKIKNLYYSIDKYDKSIPFSGKWRDNKSKNNIQKKLGSKSIEILAEIYDKLNRKASDWDVDSYSIVWKFYFEKEYDFDYQIITKSGFENAVDQLFTELVELKDATEELIDEFVELYKEKQK